MLNVAIWNQPVWGRHIGKWFWSKVAELMTDQWSHSYLWCRVSQSKALSVAHLPGLRVPTFFIRVNYFQLTFCPPREPEKYGYLLFLSSFFDLWILTPWGQGFTSSPYLHSPGAVRISLINWGLNSSPKDTGVVRSAALGLTVCICQRTFDLWRLNFLPEAPSPDSLRSPRDFHPSQPGSLRCSCRPPCPHPHHLQSS